MWRAARVEVLVAEVNGQGRWGPRWLVEGMTIGRGQADLSVEHPSMSELEPFRLALEKGEPWLWGAHEMKSDEQGGREIKLVEGDRILLCPALYLEVQSVELARYPHLHRYPAEGRGFGPQAGPPLPLRAATGLDVEGRPREEADKTPPALSFQLKDGTWTVQEGAAARAPLKGDMRCGWEGNGPWLIGAPARPRARVLLKGRPARLGLWISGRDAVLGLPATGAWLDAERGQLSLRPLPRYDLQLWADPESGEWLCSRPGEAPAPIHVGQVWALGEGVEVEADLYDAPPRKVTQRGDGPIQVELSRSAGQYTGRLSCAPLPSVDMGPSLARVAVALHLGRRDPEGWVSYDEVLLRYGEQGMKLDTVQVYLGRLARLAQKQGMGIFVERDPKKGARYVLRGGSVSCGVQLQPCTRCHIQPCGHMVLP